MGATSIHVQAVKPGSEIHNFREKELDYVRPELSHLNESWVGDSISHRLESAKQRYFDTVGQKMQTKAAPIREGVIVIKQETTMQELQQFAAVCKERFGIEAFQIHIHKDEEIAGLNKRLKELQAEKERLQEQHKSEIGKLRDGYQKEIEAAIRRAEAAERHSKEKDAVIDRQRKQIDRLDRKANPQRYSLSSGAELVRINVSNYRNPSLHIWTRVGEELFEDTKFQIDYDVAQRHFNGQITDEEFVNAVFEPQEQVNGKQAELLGTVFTLAVGGPSEVHVGTGGGGASSDLPWSKKKHDNNITSFKLKR